MIRFFEKPGCVNNTRQKRMLTAAGVRFEARDLLAEPWTLARLRPFFGERPLATWFNPSAPRLKSGEVNPALLDEAAALAAMVADPLLIRRPLIAGDGWFRCGFDPDELERLLGVHFATRPLADLEHCPHPDRNPCSLPEATP